MAALVVLPVALNVVVSLSVKPIYLSRALISIAPTFALVKAPLITASTWGLLIAIGALGLGTSVTAMKSAEVGVTSMTCRAPVLVTTSWLKSPRSRRTSGGALSGRLKSMR